jgi:hypothetical protein
MVTLSKALKLCKDSLSYGVYLKILCKDNFFNDWNYFDLKKLLDTVNTKNIQVIKIDMKYIGYENGQYEIGFTITTKSEFEKLKKAYYKY